MNKRLALIILAAAVLGTMLASGVAIASSSAPAKKLSVVPIVMGDPGCHWFQVDGKKLAKLTVAGPTAFKNLDEAALVFKGPGLNTHVAVGATIAVTKAGTYHITMVGQHGDDNHLVLVVK